MRNKPNWGRGPVVAVLGWLTIGLASAPATVVATARGGEALLVPYVLCDSTPVDAAGTPRFDTDIYLTLSAVPPDSELGYWFFDARGRVQLGGSLPAHANALVPANWCAIPGVSGNPDVDGRPGYLLFADKLAADNSGASFTLWGEAWLHRTELSAVASIPVLALADGANTAIDPDGVAGPPNEVTYLHGVPERVVPWRNGIKLNNHDGATGNRYWLSVQYLLENLIIGLSSNSFVFWFDQDCSGGVGECDRTSVPAEIYNLGGFRQDVDGMDLSYPLDRYHFDVLDQAGEGEENDPWLVGMHHTETIVIPRPLPVDDSGHVFLAIEEGVTPGIADREALPGLPGNYHAGVAFSLLYIKADGAAAPVELEMARERGFD